MVDSPPLCEDMARTGERDTAARDTVADWNVGERNDENLAKRGKGRHTRRKLGAGRLARTNICEMVSKEELSN